MGYKELEIWREARQLVIDIHQMTLRQLPKFEIYEVGSQIRRSMKSVKANIVEGYGRRDYKNDFIRFLGFARASLDETADHLDTLFDTGSLKDEALYLQLRERLDSLGRKLNNFIKTVRSSHRSIK